MILTDYYKGVKMTDAESRFDVKNSTQSYEPFESLLINKRKFNVGGLSFNYVPRPANFKGIDGRRPDRAITKGNDNISGVYVPDLQNNHLAHGNINGTNDALIIVFSEDRLTIELFIARGYKNDETALYQKVKAGDLDAEMEALRAIAKDVFKG